MELVERPALDPENVLRIVAEVLGGEAVADASFVAQGGDSFHAVLVVARIEETWQIEADFTDVLQLTPAQLADALADAPRLP
ncbi:acyl carrier protein [Streptomyces sp. NBC_01304]|uniref:acyl carrier protein n=1 Tax=Streptomyces sp. NBC_01304 TaxID=2903818 RepID=UPI002E150046|nr:acyl carrier protein [Streptomyces sp. NBC_01304]